ncbi:MAG: TonB-dependent receptor, partial [Pseudomonadota bacterium]
AERVQVLTNGIGVIDVSAASPDHQVTADGIDADKVEILRGPAALAYGGQAIGGVVNVIDGLIAEEQPEDLFSGDVFGAYNSVSEGSELAGKLQASSGPFVFALSASQRDFDNYDIPDFAESALLRAMEEEEHGDEEHEGEEEHEEEEVRGTLENSFVETQTLGAGVSYVGDRGFLGIAVRQQTATYGLPGHSHEEGEHDHSDIATALMPVSAGEGEEEEEEAPFIDLEQTRVDLRGGLDFGETGFTNVLATLAIVDYEHSEFEAPGEVGTFYSTEGIEGRVEVGTAFSGLEGAVGLQFIDKELFSEGEEAFITPTDTQSFGVFVYQRSELANGLGLEGGARFETVELDNISGTSKSFDLFGLSVGANTDVGNGVFLGAQASLAERAPNESELFAFGAHLATEQFEVGDETLDKESGLSLEGTARWSNDQATLGVNLFVTSFSNFTYLTPGTIIEDGIEIDEEDGLPVFVFIQEDADFLGGEIFATYGLDDGPLGADWDFNASLDFVSAEFDGGSNVPFIPPVTLNAGTSAEWGAWEVGASVVVAGDQDDAGVGQLPTDGYTVLNLRGEVDLSDFGFGANGTEAFIEARNVTDEEVRFATSVLKDVAPAPGQNIRVGLRLAF